MIIQITPVFRFRFSWPKPQNKYEERRLKKETVAEVLRSLNQYYYGENKKP